MRIAHCSDLHLLSHDGARWIELANKRWIGAMNLISNRSRHYHVAAFDDMVKDLNEQGVEHVLCTGDVTNLALPREFAFARAKFDQLALGPTQITVIPGNHDAYVAAGIPLFADAFGPFATTDDGWEWAEEDRIDGKDDIHWPIVRVRGDVALIGCSTSRQQDPDRRDPPSAGRQAREEPDPRASRPPPVRRGDRRARGRSDRARTRTSVSCRGAAGPVGSRPGARHLQRHVSPQQAREDRALSHLRDRGRAGKRRSRAHLGSRDRSFCGSVRQYLTRELDLPLSQRYGGAHG